MAQTDTTTIPMFKTTECPEPVTQYLGGGYAEVHLGYYSRTVRILNGSTAGVGAAIAELRTLVEMETQA